MQEIEKANSELAEKLIVLQRKIDLLIPTNLLTTLHDKIEKKDKEMKADKKKHATMSKNLKLQLEDLKSDDYFLDDDSDKNIFEFLYQVCENYNDCDPDQDSDEESDEDEDSISKHPIRILQLYLNHLKSFYANFYQIMDSYLNKRITSCLRNLLAACKKAPKDGEDESKEDKAEQARKVSDALFEFKKMKANFPSLENTQNIKNLIQKDHKVQMGLILLCAISFYMYTNTRFLPIRWPKNMREMGQMFDDDLKTYEWMNPKGKLKSYPKKKGVGKKITNDEGLLFFESLFDDVLRGLLCFKSDLLCRIFKMDVYLEYFFLSGLIIDQYTGTEKYLEEIIKTSEAYDLNVSLKMAIMLLNSYRRGECKQYYARLLSKISQKSAGVKAIFDTVVESNFPNIIQKKTVLAEIFLHIPEGIDKNDYFILVIYQIFKILYSKASEENFEHLSILLQLLLQILKSQPIIGKKLVVRKFLMKFYEIGLIDIKNLTDGSVIYDYSSSFRNVHQKKISSSLLQKDLGFLRIFMELEPTPHEIIIEGLSEVMEHLLNLYTEVKAIPGKHLDTLREDLESIIECYLIHKEGSWRELFQFLFRPLYIYKNDLHKLKQILYKEITFQKIPSSDDRSIDRDLSEKNLKADLLKKMLEEMKKKKEEKLSQQAKEEQKKEEEKNEENDKMDDDIFQNIGERNKASAVHDDLQEPTQEPEEEKNSPENEEEEQPAKEETEIGENEEKKESVKKNEEEEEDEKSYWINPLKVSCHYSMATMYKEKQSIYFSLVSLKEFLYSYFSLTFIENSMQKNESLLEFLLESKRCAVIVKQLFMVLISLLDDIRTEKENLVTETFSLKDATDMIVKKLEQSKNDMEYEELIPNIEQYSRMTNMIVLSSITKIAQKSDYTILENFDNYCKFLNLMIHSQSEEIIKLALQVLIIYLQSCPSKLPTSPKLLLLRIFPKIKELENHSSPEIQELAISIKFHIVSFTNEEESNETELTAEENKLLIASKEKEFEEIEANIENDEAYQRSMAIFYLKGYIQKYSSFFEQEHMNHILKILLQRLREFDVYVCSYAIEVLVTLGECDADWFLVQVIQFLNKKDPFSNSLIEELPESDNLPEEPTEKNEDDEDEEDTLDLVTEYKAKIAEALFKFSKRLGEALETYSTFPKLVEFLLQNSDDTKNSEFLRSSYLSVLAEVCKHLTNFNQQLALPTIIKSMINFIKSPSMSIEMKKPAILVINNIVKKSEKETLDSWSEEIRTGLENLIHTEGEWDEHLKVLAENSLNELKNKDTLVIE